MMEVGAERLRVRNGRVFVESDPSRGMAIEEITQAIAPNTLQGRGAREAGPEGMSARTFGAQFVEVEVDAETGGVTVLRVVTAHDVGRIVNPTLADSQIVGGIIQGVGFGLTEERVVDARLGMPLNANLEEYKVPTVADAPPIEHVHVDVADPHANPTGAKGIGEPPLIPTGPAIANAVFDAVGVRVREAPLTRRRVLEALRGAQSNGQEASA
jgi:xanthine dehydrogenase YagR molybdenum-binding subunit